MDNRSKHLRDKVIGRPHERAEGAPPGTTVNAKPGRGLIDGPFEHDRPATAKRMSERRR